MFLKYELPLKERDIDSLKTLNQRFCVVGIFSSFADNCSANGIKSKESILKQFVGRVPSENTKNSAASTLCGDEGLRNNTGSSREAYLELTVDVSKKLAVMSISFSDLFKKNSAAALSLTSPVTKGEILHAKLTLLLMHVCQLVLFVQQSTTFSTRTVRFLRILEMTRQNFVSPFTNYVSQKLKNSGLQISDMWMRLGGRFCAPRFVLCCICQEYFFKSFDTSSSPISNNASGDPEKASTKEQKPIASFKKYCNALEDEIFHILRKNWIFQEHPSSNVGLVAAPAPKKAFVYMLQLNRGSNPVVYLLEQLVQGVPRKEPKLEKKSFGSVDGCESFSYFWNEHVEPVLKMSAASDNHGGAGYGGKYNFNDSSLEMPGFDVWLSYLNVIIEFFLASGKELKSFDSLRSMLDTQNEFSNARCAKALPLALRVYQDNLPARYTSEKHQLHLQSAIAYFSNYARGANFDRYLSELKENCVAYWENGHQLCEVLSLTKHHCIYPFHFLTDSQRAASKSGIKSGTSVKPHSSKLRSSSACNCGKRVGNREDPFTLIDANVTFYRDMEKRCCGKLESIVFPVRVSSTSEKAGVPKTLRKDDSDISGKNPTNPVILDVRALESSQTQGSEVHGSRSATLTLEDLSITEANDLGQSFSDYNPVKLPVQKTIGNLAQRTNSCNSVSAEGTEVRPGFDWPMLCSECPSGFLPSVNMWSLVKFDVYASYDINNGLSLPGFVHGTNFLLPFDVAIVHSAEESWPVLSSSASSGAMDQSQAAASSKATNSQSGHKNQSDSFLPVTVSNKTARAYIGYEYECFKGTRLFLARRDIPVKGSPTGPDVALNAIKSDMPLYHSCSCRASKNVHFLQLTRLHIITPPKTLLKVNPMVSTIAGNKQRELEAEFNVLFFPQWDPIPLAPDSHWVLRFPFIYCGSNEPVCPPRDTTTASFSCLKANFLSGASFISS